MRPSLEKYLLTERVATLRAAKLEAMRLLIEAFETEPPLTVSEIGELVLAVGVRQPVFDNLVYPVLAKGVEEKSLEAIKTLIKLIQQLYAYQQRHSTWKFSLADLVDGGLKIDPSDVELLIQKYQSLRNYLNYTIHEVPRGVLWDADSADAAQCQNLLQASDELEQLGQLLHEDDHKLLAKCRYYYRSYVAYLAQRNYYTTFKHYLDQHSA